LVTSQPGQLEPDLVDHDGVAGLDAVQQFVGVDRGPL
jgi:hypothetical protein